MTAQELFELLNPLWLKHPGTRPARERIRPTAMEHGAGSTVGCWTEEAADLAAIAIVKWLLVRCSVLSNVRMAGKLESGFAVDAGDKNWEDGPSLLSALVSAAMAMEAE